MLESSPGVAHLVRNVVVSQRKGEVCQWYDLHLLRSALTALTYFPALTSVTLDGLWFGESKLYQLPPSHVSFPSVRRLCISACTFDAFDDIQQLCNAFPALDSLQLEGVWWGRWTSNQGFANGGVTSQFVLKELDLGSCFSRDKVLEWLLSKLPKPTIETLRLPLIGAYDTRLRDLLLFIGPSLRHLELGSPSMSTVRTRSMSPFYRFRSLHTNTVSSHVAGRTQTFGVIS